MNVLLGALGVSLGCASPAQPLPKEAMGRLPSGTTTAVPEWLPTRVFSGEAIALAPGEERLANARRLTTGYAVTATAFAADGSSAFFVGREAKAAAQTLSLYRVALATSPGKSADLVRVSAAEEDVVDLAVGPEGVLYRVRSGEWLTREEDKSKPVPALVGAEFVAFPARSAGPVALGALARSGEAIERAVSFPMAKAPGGERSFSGPWAGVRPAVSRDGESLAFGVPKDACNKEKSRAKGPHACDAAHGIALVSREGRGRTDVLTLGPYQVADLAFVPGHEALLFTSDRDREASELYLLPLSGDRQLLRLTFAGARALAVSSDGRKLLFASQRAGESADLFLASLVEAL
jgi:hypothetical protein